MSTSNSEIRATATAETEFGRVQSSRQTSHDADKEITLEGFRKAMEAALELHKGSPANKSTLAGKQPKPLTVKHVGEYGEHAVAKRAGFRKGDIIVEFDGRTEPMSESTLLAHAIQKKQPGDQVPVTVLRDGERVELKLPMQ